MKKKLIMCGIIGAMIVTGVGCGNGESDKSNTNTSSSQAIESNGTIDEKVASECEGFYSGDYHHYKPEEIAEIKGDNPVKEVENTDLKNNYYIELTSDTNWEIDLDGDGNKEQVCLKYYDYYDNNIEDTASDYAIYINNTLYAIDGAGNKGGDVYIIDMDSSDNKYEIASCSYYGFVAHAWVNNQFVECVYGWNNEYGAKDFNFKDYLNIEGMPGLTKGTKRMDCICGWVTSVKEQYNSKDYTSTLVEENAYDILVDEPDYTTLGLLNDIEVYSENDKNSTKLTISRQDISFRKIGYDDKNVWLYVESADGTTGWIYVEVGEEETIGGKGLEYYFSVDSMTFPN